MRNRVRKCRSIKSNNTNNNNNNTSNDNNLSENSNNNNKNQGKKKQEEEEKTLLQCNEYSDANIYNRLKDAIRSVVFILVRTIATVYNFSFSVCVSKVPSASASALSDMVKKRQTSAAAQAAASEARETASSTDSGEEELLNGHHHHHHPRHHHQYQTGNQTVCPHVKKSVDTARLRRQLKATGLLFECGQCPKVDEVNGASGGDESDNTLWLCLKCGTQLCGRARNQHALQHHQKPHSDSHAIALNTRTFKIWCYSCDLEVNAKSRKNLLECVELVKRLAQKPPKQEPPVINNIEYKIKSTLEQMSHMVPLTGATDTAAAIPLPPPPPAAGSFGSVPGMAKRITDLDPSSRHLERLPRVRGLTNLGNTCFFNAVMQCLAQTPFLLAVLKELAEPGEEFVLPGGTFNFKEKGDIELPTIKGTLSSWGNLTAALANALEELQSGGGVFTPSKLFDRLCAKCPQFTGGDQHDAHELLRQLLESVRSEDLQRYQRVILQNLGYQDINSVSEELRQKCKIYGNQAADRILRPEQVFRGFLVSTLTCQDCFNVSSRHEYFLDMSLPVAVEKPQPPQRRKTSPENSPSTAAAAATAAANFSNNSTGGSINAKFSNGDTDVIFTEHSSFYLHHDQQEPLGPSKAQVKKEKERERKAKRAAKHQRTKAAQKLSLHTTTNNSNNSSSSNASSSNTSNNTSSSTISSSNNSTTGAGDHYHANDEEREQQPGTAWGEGQRADTLSLSATTSEHSDADVEDNVAEDNAAKAAATVAGAGRSAKYYKDSNGNAQHMDKDSLEEDENDSGIATSPAPTATAAAAVAVVKEAEVAAADDNGDDDEEEASTAASLVNAGLSEEGASIIRELSSGQLQQQMEQLSLREQAQNVARLKRVRTQSYSDWSTTIAPRYQCDVGECSVPSCLNNFSAVELMTGQNKVGCESCTRRINGPDPQAKSVNTNATKQLLISSPPAVLILHLKRFQLGPRCVFRKLTRPVTYTVLLDIAAFCGSKVKNLPNIDRKQKKLLYALYGVVEHSGGLYGGHYTAYVKVRPKVTPDDKRWKFLPHGSKAELDQDDEQLKKLEESLVKSKAREMRRKAMDDSDDFTSSSNASTSDEAAADLLLQNGTNDATAAATTATPAAPEPAATTEADEAANVQAPPGKWYYVSDSRVQEVSEEEALKAQAYLLFYERIY